MNLSGEYPNSKIVNFYEEIEFSDYYGSITFVADIIKLKTTKRETPDLAVPIVNLATPDGTDLTQAVNVEYVNALITKIEKLENAIVALGGTIEE